MTAENQTPPGSFWLYQWLDSYSIKSTERAMILLQESGPLAALKETAEAAMAAGASPSEGLGPTIVAGADLDLSGNIGCISFRCRRRQLENLFSHVWHYFDTIAVVGVSPRRFLGRLDEKPDPHQVPFMESLEAHIRLLIYIRNIGATDLLRFIDKPRGKGNWRQQIIDAGLKPLLKPADDQIARLTREAHFHFTPIGGYLDYELRHPSLRRPFEGHLTYNRPTVSAKRHAAEQVVAACSLQLVADMRAALSISAPLGTDYPLHERMIQKFSKTPLTEADVAFRLRLPVLEGVDPELLIKIRRDEQQHFEAFRNSLRVAIRERLNTAEGNPDKIAREIRQDVIDPALNDIERRLAAARKVLVDKIGLSVALGSLATTCGLLTANPLAVTTGIGAVATSLSGGYKFIEDRRDIALSDMYFLWKPQRHLH